MSYHGISLPMAKPSVLLVHMNERTAIILAVLSAGAACCPFALVWSEATRVQRVLARCSWPVKAALCTVACPAFALLFLPVAIVRLVIAVWRWLWRMLDAR